MEEGSQSVNRKGSDASEVFDLRTYQPGDDIHTIHWKLSQKTDELLVREPADSPRFDTLVLMDIGRFDHMIPQDPKQLSLTAALTLSISQAFLNYQLLTTSEPLWAVISLSRRSGNRRIWTALRTSG